MTCKRYSSERQSRFNSEVNIHFPGREGWDRPTVWVFPEIMVCLDCGFAEFSMPGVELHALAAEGAA